METRYHPGSDIDYVLYVKGLPPERAQLVNVGGFHRWKITDKEGYEYILRPQSSREIATNFEITIDKSTGETVNIRAL